MPEYPLVSIVTPVLNMAKYVEETVLSVLAQDYPRTEYIVMDGGSTDGTLEIVRRYEGRLRCEPGPDEGASDAINRGFRLSSGSIFAWLNADDTYAPGAVRTAVEHLLAHPEAGGVYGEANWIGADGGALGRYPVRPFDPELLSRECFICQPASLLRRDVFEQAGHLDPALHYTFDYDLWIRLSRIARLEKIDAVLANSRMHRETKTLGSRKEVFRETLGMLRRHYGYAPFSWACAYACFLVDKRDQFFEPLRPSVPKYALSLLVGWRYNSQRLRFFKEWAAGLTLPAAVRHLKRTVGRPD
ncbi:MAG: glycosyltransferase family 2 protein [Acidobacteriota bacterium]